MLPTAHPIHRILADPMIRAVMKADGIEVTEMKSLLCNVRRRLAASPDVGSRLLDQSGAEGLAAASTGRLAQGTAQSW